MERSGPAMSCSRGILSRRIFRFAHTSRSEQSSLALQMLNGISKAFNELLTLTLVNDVVQVVVDVSYVALVPWIDLASDPVSIRVKGLTLWVVVKH